MLMIHAANRTPNKEPETDDEFDHDNGIRGVLVDELDWAVMSAEMLNRELKRLRDHVKDLEQQRLRNSVMDAHLLRLQRAASQLVAAFDSMRERVSKVDDECRESFCAVIERDLKAFRRGEIA